MNEDMQFELFRLTRLWIVLSRRQASPEELFIIQRRIQELHQMTAPLAPNTRCSWHTRQRGTIGRVCVRSVTVVEQCGDKVLVRVGGRQTIVARLALRA